MVRALASYLCCSGSILGVDSRARAICRLSLFLVLFAPRGFSSVTPVFPSPQKALGSPGVIFGAGKLLCKIFGKGHGPKESKFTLVNLFKEWLPNRKKPRPTSSLEKERCGTIWRLSRHVGLDW